MGKRENENRIKVSDKVADVKKYNRLVRGVKRIPRKPEHKGDGSGQNQKA